MTRRIHRRLLWLAAALALAGCGGGTSRLPGAGLVAVLTDLGDDDFAGGALRGAILRADPAARLVSISQQVPAFDVREGAYWLQQAARQYPAGTVFLAVVDPLVGTSGEQKIVAVTQTGQILCGPDNGLLSFALAEAGVAAVYTLNQPALVAPGAFDQPPSQARDTYDIFGYAAGRLAAGVSPAAAGPLQATWAQLTVAAPTVTGTSLSGEVLHIDHFGNLTTNLPVADAQQAGYQLGQPLRLTVGTQTVTATYAQTFGDVPTGQYLVFAEAGYLRVAINLGNAATGLGAKAGTGIGIGL